MCETKGNAHNSIQSRESAVPIVAGLMCITSFLWRSVERMSRVTLRLFARPTIASFTENILLRTDRLVAVMRRGVGAVNLRDHAWSLWLLST